MFSDELLLAINKPAGLLTLPDGYDPQAPHVKGLLEQAWGKLWVVHRLDKETSGVLLLARTALAHRQLNMQFESHQVEKVYHALVLGNPDWDETSADQPLRVDGDRRHRTVVDTARGKPALTRFRVLERFERYSLVEARPETGRTHQIRAHLSALGYSLVGDGLYGDNQGLYLSEIKPGFSGGRKGECALMQRVGLHARSLKFTHPGSEEDQTIEAPFPKDFNGVLRQLRKYGARAILD